MELGVLVFPQEDTMRPDQLAREAEDRGFESVFYPEHSHLPLASDRWPGGPEIPDGYARTMDQFVSMTAAAMVTERIMIGTGICLVPQHHPAWLAKQVATLDVLSGGRVILGIGFGWNPAELADHGVAYEDRRAITRETILAMKSLWSDEIASYEGQHVSISPSRVWPKPVQDPHPKIIIGAGAGPKLYQAVAEYADGWGPLRGRDEIDEHLEPLRQVVSESGRTPDELDITVFGAPTDAEGLGELADRGVTRAVFAVPPASQDTVLPFLDRCAAFVNADAVLSD